MTEQVRADLEEASRFVAKGDYLQGLVYLKRVAELEHPRFADAARRAKAKIEQIKGERDRRTEEAQTLVEQARQRLRSGDRKGAVIELKRIPLSLRTRDAEILLAELEAELSEISTLAAELSAAARFSSDLLEKWARLVDFQPDHPQAVDVARRICPQAIQAAKAALTQRQYRKAMKVLDRIPPAARTPEMESLRGARPRSTAWSRPCGPRVGSIGRWWRSPGG